MFDLLSLAVLIKVLINTSSIIVLNSVSFIKDIEHLIINYEEVYLYLDNDTPGENATKHLVENYNQVIDQSYTYKNHKDLNDLLCYEKREEI